MGKREMGKLSTIDIVVSILIAEMCAISIENYNESILFSIIPILILLFFELTSSYLSVKFNKFRNVVDGKPSLIINKGIINYKEMMKQRYTLDDLMIELRNNNISDLRDVCYAVLENNGHLNVFKYNINLPFPLILDGIIQTDTLDYINKNEKWLYEYLENNNLNKEDIFYGFYKNNKIYVILKNDTLS
jgi:uncharacterized membrane protein YcaP (DUF421 family)